VKVGDLIKCIDGDLYIVFAISESAWRNSVGEVTSPSVKYADLIHAVTFETGAVLRIDDNPYYEVISESR
jgi:hypothetical protein